MPSPVVDQLAVLRAAMNDVYATPCATCGHPFLDHDHGTTLRKCWHPRVVRDGADTCKCRQFVDPCETLQGVR